MIPPNTPHLQRGNAQRPGDGPRQDMCALEELAVGVDLPRDAQHAVDGRVHRDIADQPRQHRDLLFLFGHADRDTQREQHRQVAENRIAHRQQNRIEAVHKGARPEKRRQMIGRRGGLVGKYRTETEQDPRDGQKRDRQRPTRCKTPKILSFTVSSLRFLYGYWFDHFIANRLSLQSFSAVVTALFFAGVSGAAVFNFTP